MRGPARPATGTRWSQPGSGKSGAGGACCGGLLRLATAAAEARLSPKGEHGVGSRTREAVEVVGSGRPARHTHVTRTSSVRRGGRAGHPARQERPQVHRGRVCARGTRGANGRPQTPDAAADATHPARLRPAHTHPGSSRVSASRKSCRRRSTLRFDRPVGRRSPRPRGPRGGGGSSAAAVGQRLDDLVSQCRSARARPGSDVGESGVGRGRGPVRLLGPVVVAAASLLSDGNQQAPGSSPPETRYAPSAGGGRTS
jgi:hypothetical protein